MYIIYIIYTTTYTTYILCRHDPERYALAHCILNHLEVDLKFVGRQEINNLTLLRKDCKVAGWLAGWLAW